MARWPTLALALAAAAPAAAQSRPTLSDRGLDSLRQDVAIDSVDAEAYYRLGLGLWQKKRYDAADSTFQQALHFQPWHAGAHLALSLLLVSRGPGYLRQIEHRQGRDSAFAVLRAALTHEAEAEVLDPRLDMTPLAFLKDDELVPSTTTISFGGGQVWEEPTRQMRRALRDLIEQRPESAYATLAAVLAARKPQQLMRNDFISLYASAALRSGHPKEAANGYRELARRATRHEAGAGAPPVDLGPIANVRGHMLLMYGVAAMEDHQLDVARAAFHDALLTDLTLYQAHAQLADLAEAEGDLEGALTERHAAIDIAPETARPYLDLGITLLQAGRNEEAEAALIEAAQRLPWDPGIELFLFQAAMATRDRATAERALAALDRYAPRRNHDQVVEAHHRLDEVPPP